MKKAPFLLFAIVLLSNDPLSTGFAQGTAFTYQGQLSSGTNPANGRYDLTFALFDAPTGGTQQGHTLTNAAAAISNGLFTVTLDFGNQFPGSGRWLEISARTNGTSAFITLAPRQPLTSSPYAIQAITAGSVAATNITGTLTPAQLPSVVVTNGMSGVNITGAFNGNGAGLTNLNLSRSGLVSNYTGVATNLGIQSQLNGLAALFTVNRDSSIMQMFVTNTALNKWDASVLIPTFLFEFPTGTNGVMARFGDPGSPGNRGKFYLNTSHNLGEPTDPNVGEWQIDTPGSVAIGVGFGNEVSGTGGVIGGKHIQLGIGPGPAGTPHPFWSYWQNAMVNDSTNPVGFSGAYTCDAEGFGMTTKFPGMLGRYISTNSGGTWELDLFRDLGVAFTATHEDWDAREGSSTLTHGIRILGGATNSIIFYGTMDLTNLTIGTTKYWDNAGGNAQFYVPLAGNASGLTNLNASALASGTVPNAQLPATRFATNGFIPQIKPQFTMNYAVTDSDCVLFCRGTNQVITLLNATNATTVPGKTFTIIAASTTGSVIVTNANGVQTILGMLSQRINSTNKLTLITDGSNWW